MYAWRNPGKRLPTYLRDGSGLTGRVGKDGAVEEWQCTRCHACVKGPWDEIQGLMTRHPGDPFQLLCPTCEGQGDLFSLLEES
jgi:hypothetical protein